MQNYPRRKRVARVKTKTSNKHGAKCLGEWKPSRRGCGRGAGGQAAPRGQGEDAGAAGAGSHQLKGEMRSDKRRSATLAAVVFILVFRFFRVVPGTRFLQMYTSTVWVTHLPCENYLTLIPSTRSKFPKCGYVWERVNCRWALPRQLAGI